MIRGVLLLFILFCLGPVSVWAADIKGAINVDNNFIVVHSQAETHTIVYQGAHGFKWDEIETFDYEISQSSAELSECSLNVIAWGPGNGKQGFAGIFAGDKSPIYTGGSGISAVHTNITSISPALMLNQTQVHEIMNSVSEGQYNSPYVVPDNWVLSGGTIWGPLPYSDLDSEIETEIGEEFRWVWASSNLARKTYAIFAIPCERLVNPKPTVVPTPNRPPVGSDQTISITSGRANGNLLNYTSDPDSDSLSIVDAKSVPRIPFGYGREGNFNITFPSNGTYVFKFTVSDGRGGIGTVNIRYNVTGVSPPPPPPPPPPPKFPDGLLLCGILLLAIPFLYLAWSRARRPSPQIIPNGQVASKPEKPPEAGVVFLNSPLLPAAVVPGPAPLVPAGHMAPSGLQTLTGQYSVLKPAYLATGRIGGPQEGVPTNDDVSFGTGFLITPNHIMTNRHVYEFYKHYLTGPDCGGIEFIAERDRDASDYVAFDGEPPILISGLDIAIFKLVGTVTDRVPIDRVSIPTEELDTRDMVTISYPCPFEVDEVILSVVEDDPIFAVKRISQGKVFRHSTDTEAPYGVQVSVDTKINSSKRLSAICHNASTLGGSSGAPILDLEGKLVGVHFAGDRAFNGEEAANLAMAIELLSNVGPNESNQSV